MADILIRGIKAPDDCGSCVFCVNEMFDKFCPLSDSYYDWSESSNGSRPDNCPIPPLPEKHGRLIDADALLLDAGDVFEVCGDGFTIFGFSREQIENAPTIVSAEGGPDDGN